MTPYLFGLLVAFVSLWVVCWGPAAAIERRITHRPDLPDAGREPITGPSGHRIMAGAWEEQYVEAALAAPLPGDRTERLTPDALARWRRLYLAQGAPVATDVPRIDSNGDLHSQGGLHPGWEARRQMQPGSSQPAMAHALRQRYSVGGVITPVYAPEFILTPEQARRKAAEARASAERWAQHQATLERQRRCPHDGDRVTEQDLMGPRPTSTCMMCGATVPDGAL
jgi:hypothetical protein